MLVLFLIYALVWIIKIEINFRHKYEIVFSLNSIFKKFYIPVNNSSLYGINTLNFYNSYMLLVYNMVVATNLQKSAITIVILTANRQHPTNVKHIKMKNTTSDHSLRYFQILHQIYVQNATAGGGWLTTDSRTELFIPNRNFKLKHHLILHCFIVYEICFPLLHEFQLSLDLYCAFSTVVYKNICFYFPFC